MAASTNLKLTNRSPKQPIKKLPPTTELPQDATVEHLKMLIAEQVGFNDHNRIGLFDPETKKTIKDRKALIADIPSVVAKGEVLVKDLGYQIAWKTVFLVEYFGPILLHSAVVAARPYLYKNGDSDMSRTQWITFAMVILHFVKREYETMFVHKFSANTMPWVNIFRNSAFYWIFSGLLCAYFVYSPTSLAATADFPSIDAVGIALYVFGETSNAMVHQYLSSLRSAGGTERKIPVGYGFNLVTCPNYMFEILSWIGVIIVSRSWTVALFIGIGAAQMYDWAKGKERAYRQEFGDSYKKKRYVMLPGFL